MLLLSSNSKSNFCDSCFDSLFPTTIETTRATHTLDPTLAFTLDRSLLSTLPAAFTSTSTHPSRLQPSPLSPPCRLQQAPSPLHNPRPPHSPPSTFPRKRKPGTEHHSRILKSHQHPYQGVNLIRLPPRVRSRRARAFA